MAPVKPGRPHRRATLREERAEVTRARIADAARRLFTRDGYAATTLTAIAVEAGVAVQTVYAVYVSKAGILQALRESAMSQPEAEAAYAAAMGEPSPRRRLELFAHSIRLRWESSGEIVTIHRDAGTADPAVRAGVDEALRRRRAGIAALAATLEGELRPGMGKKRAGALLDALSLPEVYLELVGVQGWDGAEYETWLVGVLTRELLGAG
jgi:AcrR family transcriptional regulator